MEVAASDLLKDGIDRVLRRRGTDDYPRIGLGYTGVGLVRPDGGHGYECDSGGEENEREHETLGRAARGRGGVFWLIDLVNLTEIGAHDILPRTRSRSLAATGLAGGRTTSCNRLRSGISTRKIAKMLLPMGRMPHMIPCQAGGRCGESIGVAGATLSRAQIEIVRSSRSPMRRHPEKTNNGS